MCKISSSQLLSNVDIANRAQSPIEFVAHDIVVKKVRSRYIKSQKSQAFFDIKVSSVLILQTYRPFPNASSLVGKKSAPLLSNQMASQATTNPQ
jgi:hypothetical protein